MISNAEMDRRWTAVREMMADETLDWIIATTGHPFGYYRWLTDRVGLGGPLAAIGLRGDVILASHGDAVHHRPHDSYGVRHVASCSQLNTLVNTHAPLLVTEMRAGGSVRRIGLAGTGFLSVATRDVLVTAFPDAELVDVTDQMARLKAIKSDEEMQYIRNAARMHDEAVELARRTIRPGISGRDVIEEVRSFFTRQGSPVQSLMAGSAPRTEICRYSGPAERIIQPGDLFSMLIECATESGYYSECMPTFALDEVPAHLQKAFDDAVECQQMLVDSVRVGMLPAELLAKNDAFMAEHSYPGEHRLLGHSQGLDLVERPAFSPLGETLAIEHGMVLSIHPTVHTQNAWGLPNNLSFHFTRNGIERLSKTPQEVFVV